MDMSGELIVAAMNVPDIGKGRIDFADMQDQLVNNLGIDLKSIVMMHEGIFRADAYSFLFNLDIEMHTDKEETSSTGSTMTSPCQKGLH